MNHFRGRIAKSLLAGLVAGTVATSLLVLVMAAARVWLGISPPPEALPDRFAPTLSIEEFFRLFNRYGGYNGLKRFGIKAGLTGLVGGGTIFGLIFAAFAARRQAQPSHDRRRIPRSSWLFAGAAVAVVWVATVAVSWPVLATNFRGLPPERARMATMAGLLLAYAIYALALIAVYHLLVRPSGSRRSGPDREDSADGQAVAPSGGVLARRTLLAAGASGLLAVPSVGLIRRLNDDAVFGYDGRPYSGPGIQPITPNDQFYSVTKNVVDPDVSKSVWALQVGGLVDRGRVYDFKELSAFTAVQQETTLMCISNKTGAGLFSNAVWTGVPMATLLNASGVRDGAVEVLLHAADGYTDTFAIERALDPTTLVVYEMNGEPLPRKHGFPARVIVPGLFGEKNVKWVTGIEVIDHDGKGFYETQGWGPNFEIPTRSDIFAPKWTRTGKGDRFNATFQRGQTATIKGRAFGGNRGISSVEVSTDGGGSWKRATIDYPGTKLTWSFWSFLWAPMSAGEFVILSRAVDGSGQPQTADTRGIIPQGATGYHRVTATVA